jgi:hypothetical protein
VEEDTRDWRLGLGKESNTVSMRRENPVDMDLWVEMARQYAHKQEDSRRGMLSKKVPCYTTWFVSLTKGESNQVDWGAIVVAHPTWEIEILPGDEVLGENTSLSKRESGLFGSIGSILTCMGLCGFVWGSMGLLMGIVGLCWGFTPTWVIKIF